jgi:hypothetical protein
MKITNEQLIKIQELAKNNYRNGTTYDVPGELQVSLAWIEAVMSVLQSDVELEFPQRKSTDSVFDE